MIIETNQYSMKEKVAYRWIDIQ